MQPDRREDDGASMIEVIRQQVEQRSYVVDPAQVAAAMLARREELGRLRRLRSQVLVAAEDSEVPAGERQPFTGRYTA
jgi:hypothetical protein